MSETQRISGKKHEHPQQPKTNQPALNSTDGTDEQAFSQKTLSPDLRTPSQILQLQHLIGNHAVNQLVNGRDASKKIQRAVGFEFESGAWIPFQAKGKEKEKEQSKEKEEGESKGEEEEGEGKGEKEEQQPRKASKDTSNLMFGARTFAYGVVIPAEEEDMESSKKTQVLFSGFPKLETVCKDTMNTWTFADKATLIANIAMILSATAESPFGEDVEAVDAALLGFYDGDDKPDLKEGEELPAETRKQLAAAMAAVLCANVQVISPNDMSKKELKKLRAEFGGTNIYSTLEPEARHLNKTPALAERNLEMAGKKGALHRETGFKIEADGPYERGRMDIEFVTVPFEESPAGLKALTQVLKRIRKIMQTIGKYAPKDYSKGEFVTPEQNKFSAGNVYLGDGSSKAGFKMQATKGIPLGDIPILMKYLGFGDEKEKGKQRNQRKHARRLMRGDKTEPNNDSRSLTVAPDLADTALKLLLKLVPDLPPANEKGHEFTALRGLISYMLYYIVQLNHGHVEGIKLRLTLMSRLPFSTLFAQLPPNQQIALAHNSERVTAVMEQVLAGYLPKFNVFLPLINIGTLPSKYTIPGHKPFFDMMKKLTVKDWISGVLTEHVDRLTSSGMKDYLNKLQIDTAPYDKSIDIYLRGHGNSENVVGDTAGLAIMENRDIDPIGQEEMSVEQTEEAAIAYLTFMMQLKAAKGNEKKVGKFPKLKKI